MIVYRIANLKYQDSILSGIGAEKVGGRWNEVGTRAVYTSENAALALLEYYVHSKNSAYLPKQIAIAKIYIPDEFVINEIQALPKDWNQYPYNNQSTKLFSELVKYNNFFAIKVPSAILSIENNIILNPLYEHFHQVKVMEFIHLDLDSRL